MQTIKIILISFFLVGIFCLNGYTQSKIDYSKKSNILNPDTLKGDQKKIFWHFVKLTNKEVKEYEPLKVKAEFARLGITPHEKKRFGKACVFFITTMKNHKKSVENWESFKDLVPKFKE